MKKISILILLITTVLLQSCTLQGECEGEIIIANPLPDITIQLEDGKQTIDLSSPPVFEHTANKSISYFSEVIDGGKILASGIQLDEETEDYDQLVLQPRDVGTARVYVEAGDGCINGVRNEFEVTIN